MMVRAKFYSYFFLVISRTNDPISCLASDYRLSDSINLRHPPFDLGLREAKHTEDSRLADGVVSVRP
ncbi:hypothetical protein RJ55_07757 [Drechmeria coniospora]|nr:hypothetical protein RJ55_07757 [Drechmeria coniospora]